MICPERVQYSMRLGGSEPCRACCCRHWESCQLVPHKDTLLHVTPDGESSALSQLLFSSYIPPWNTTVTVLRLADHGLPA